MFCSFVSVFRELLNTENGLLAEMKNVGLDESGYSALQQQLQEYVRHSTLPSYRGTSSSISGIDMSILDDLLHDGDAEEELECETKTDVASMQEPVNQSLSVDSVDGRHEDFDKWVTKYIRPSSTVLGQERNAYYDRMEVLPWQEATCEMDFQVFSQHRLHNLIVLFCSSEVICFCSSNQERERSVDASTVLS